MTIDLIFRIAGIGLLMAVVSQVLKGAGREDIAMVANVAGLILVLVMILTSVSDLFTTIKALFPLYS